MMLNGLFLSIEVTQSVPELSGSVRTKSWIKFNNTPFKFSGRIYIEVDQSQLI